MDSEEDEKTHLKTVAEIKSWLLKCKLDKDLKALITLNGPRLICRIREVLVDELATWLKWTRADDEYYLLPFFPKVIITYTTKNREGCEEEKECIQKCLATWSMVDPEVLKDPTKQQFEMAIGQAQKSRHSILILVVMSHGSAGHFNVGDGEINIQHLLNDIMYSDNQKDTPKVR